MTELFYFFTPPLQLDTACQLGFPIRALFLFSRPLLIVPIDQLLEINSSLISKFISNMKKRTREDEGNGIEGSKSIDMKYKNKKLKDKKKMRGLSLEAFANAKSKSNHYNPALISIKACSFICCCIYF